MRAALGAMIAAMTIGWAASAQAESAGFGDWIVVCDNVRTCSAYGFSPELSEDMAYVRLTRTGQPDAPVVASLSQMGEGAGAWRFEVDGQVVAPRVPFAAGKHEVYRRARLAPADAAALVGALAGGTGLRLFDGHAATPISLKGSSAALRWMDERQKRAGTVSALVARGARPASAVSVPPGPPVIRAAPAVSQAGLPTTLPDALKHPWESCDDDIDSLGFEPEVFRLAPGLLLWQTACSRGAYNVIYDLTLTDERGGSVRAASIPYLGGEATGELMNVEFDAGTQTLSNFDKARGLGDCGAFTSWAWTGKAFVLKSSDVMPACRGVPLDDWPTEFVSR
jgi:hypothetical protein